MNESLYKIKRLIERVLRIQKEKERVEQLSFSIIPSCEIALKEIAQIEAGQGVKTESYLFIPQPGEIYRHYKGQLYEVQAIAVDAETIEPAVIYRSLENNVVWVRSLASFTEILGNNTTQYYRFQIEKTAP